jgi:hypothetical protein
MAIRALPLAKNEDPGEGLGCCQHRTVSKDGCIVCAKIVEGDNQVTPNICRTCPFKAVNCGHLCFSLRQTSPSPLVVRYNGRTEIWDDGPPELGFEHAACAAKVMPIDHPRVCIGCPLRQAIQAPVEQHVRRRRAAGNAKVVPFPLREAAAATG